MAKRQKMTPEERALREEQDRWLADQRARLWAEIKKTEEHEQAKAAAEKQN